MWGGNIGNKLFVILNGGYDGGAGLEKGYVLIFVGERVVGWLKVILGVPMGEVCW
jgi:hypothetical protein